MHALLSMHVCVCVCVCVSVHVPVSVYVSVHAYARTPETWTSRSVAEVHCAKGWNTVDPVALHAPASALWTWSVPPPRLTRQSGPEDTVGDGKGECEGEGEWVRGKGGCG